MKLTPGVSPPHVAVDSGVASAGVASAGEVELSDVAGTDSDSDSAMKL